MRDVIEALFAVFAVPIVFLGCASLLDVPFSFWSAANCLLYPVLVFGSIALHEGGHAIVAHAVGLRVPRVEIGIGRRVWRWRWRRVLIHVNVFPLIGMTYMGSDAADQSRARLRLWVSVAMGPIATMALFALALAWSSPISLFDVIFPVRQMAGRFAPWELVAFVNLWMFVFSLLPWPLSRQTGLVFNDGRLLLSLPFWSDRLLCESLVSAEVMDAEEKREGGDLDGAERHLECAIQRVPDSWSVRCSVALILLSRGRFLEARRMFQTLLNEDLIGAFQTMIENNLAWVDFRLRSADLLPEADRLSETVYKRVPRAAWAMGTRGAVLLWKGEHRKAIPLLEGAYARTSSPENRALCACCLAIALIRLGRRRDAQQWINRARANHPACNMLDEAEEAMEASIDPADTTPAVS